MKSFTILPTLALVVAAAADCLLDSILTGASPEQIAASVDQWSSDVHNVNSFLNSAASLSTEALLSAANSALTSAQDEPCQLATLGAFVADTPTSDCAFADLQAIFGARVLMNLQKIISSPSDAQAVGDAVAEINLFRCCSVLPDAEILWTGASVRATGVEIREIVASRPFACDGLVCTSAQTNCKAAT
ncbi:hypothetical protein LTR17_008280 [Elasticomyces elasticus]|nr:hypothetical protein LTR17_008280 [Elasticomyces elasticus]